MFLLLGLYSMSIEYNFFINISIVKYLSPQTRLISQCDKVSNNTSKRSQNPPNSPRSNLALLISYFKIHLSPVAAPRCETSRVFFCFSEIF